MENKKQEAIRKAYGEYWETVKQDVDENGYLHHPKGGKVIFFDKCIGFMEEHPTADAHRPKSLSGIETNNGWILFEGSVNIPTKECNYALGKFVRGAFRYIEGQNLMKAKHALVSMQYTHYREQHNYLSPIY